MATRARWTRPAAAVSVALCAAAVLAACGTSRGSAPPGVSSKDVRALATQTRFDQVDDRLFEITLTNVGREPFTVTSVRLDSPGFVPVAAADRDEPFPPGATYDMPAHYGSARCGTALEPATAVVLLHRDGKPSASVRLPLASPDGLLRRLQEQDCARQELARQVRVSLADVRQDGLTLRGAVRVERHGSRDPITATELRDSKQFAFSVSLPAQLATSADVLDIPAVMRPTACYGHLIGDVKQPYLFPLFLRFGGGPPQYIEVATTTEQRQQLQAMLRIACAGRTS